MSTAVISSGVTSWFGISSERISRLELSRSEMSCRKARLCNSTFAMQSLQATTYTFSWLRIGRHTEIPRSEPFYSAVAGVGRASLAGPITTAESCKSGSALSPQQDFLPKVRLARSEGTISCTATQRVWSFFPSLTLTRNVGESRMFWETSNRVPTLTSERFPYTQVTYSIVIGHSA